VTSLNGTSQLTLALPWNSRQLLSHSQLATRDLSFIAEQQRPSARATPDEANRKNGNNIVLAAAHTWFARDESQSEANWLIEV
jgi:hypothetical protein